MLLKNTSALTFSFSLQTRHYGNCFKRWLINYWNDWKWIIVKEKLFLLMPDALVCKYLDNCVCLWERGGQNGRLLNEVPAEDITLTLSSRLSSTHLLQNIYSPILRWGTLILERSFWLVSGEVVRKSHNFIGTYFQKSCLYWKRMAEFYILSDRRSRWMHQIGNDEGMTAS